MTLGARLKPVGSSIVRLVSGPFALSLIPLLTLGAYWLGGQNALLAVGLGFPLMIALSKLTTAWVSNKSYVPDRVTGLLQRDGFEHAVARVVVETGETDLNSAIFLIDIDDFSSLADRHSQDAADMMAQRVADRLRSSLREADIVARLGEGRFAVCLNPVRQLDLEVCIQLAGRLQTAIEEPVSLDGLGLYVSCTIGFCAKNKVPGASATEWITAATTALSEALGNGPSSIRSFSEELRKRSRTRSDLRAEAANALTNGQIQAWFQPQISTDTGEVTGFEALARWMHPVHGVIPPNLFLPVLEDAGLTEQLGETILVQALTALKHWESQGLKIGTVGVNFATAELRNPHLADKITWQLDRFELEPQRLSVEILESVVSSGPDDIVARNVRALQQLGCQIDLDDFGTGNASIAAIKRFQIHRLKIDRSFVTRADCDPEQQKLVAAVLTMAEQLGLDTLAEGVETAGEHTLLSQLGCGHVQGFGIAKPMPFDETLGWIRTHNRKLPQTPSIERRTG